MQQLTVVPCTAAQRDQHGQSEERERPALRPVTRRDTATLRQQRQNKIRERRIAWRYRARLPARKLIERGTTR